MIYTANTVQDLDNVASQIINDLGDVRVVAFDAPMGAGKTTLIAALSKALGTLSVVNSPTFAIVNDYDMADVNGAIYHFDLYRLKSMGEVMDIGFEDYVSSGNYCFVEWPELALDLMPDNYATISISVNPDTLARTIELSFVS
ncbi:MAG: tRNA (adenosine(37)-N6)-threonylcarbamoyltransferase complex ATPase subunit type 1 TsaE [Bacteroidales bacterium]|nr:tRNA (adenosine(37)-N6)-threonylcarbamoyltransferase complex ATPase subunit type 1 TsaE [Bacteroidales bacterium]